MDKPAILRDQASELLRRIAERQRHTVQVICGPREVGKTTMAHQVIERCGLASHFASADTPLYRRPNWLTAQWQTARDLASKHSDSGGALLVLDEIQNVPHWAEYIKQYWDEDTWNGCPLKVIVAGSSPMRLLVSLREVMSGRYEVMRIPHWSFSEMRDAFGMQLGEYLFYGGYPGAMEHMSDPARWRNYILNAAIGPAVERDLPDFGRAFRRSLLLQLIRPGCSMSGHCVPHSKLCGLLANGGSISDVAACLALTKNAGMLAGLHKYSNPPAGSRRSVPKLQVFNNALFTSMHGVSFETATADTEYWGQLAESAVGAHLISTEGPLNYVVSYWREGDFEVDYVVAAKRGSRLLAIDVKTGRRSKRMSGLGKFKERFPHAQILPVLGSKTHGSANGNPHTRRKPKYAGVEGMPLDEFLACPVEQLLKL